MKRSYIGILLIILISLTVFIINSCILNERQEELNREATKEGQVAREYEEMLLEQEIEEHNESCTDTDCEYEYCDNNMEK